MRVETRPPIRGAGVTAGRSGEGARPFRLAADPANATGATTANAAATLAGLDAVLALQAREGDPRERRRRTVHRGHDLLDGLDRLKAALLGGRVATEELRAVAARLAERLGSSGDPRLDGLVAEIELRAAVELAKLERAAA